MRIICCKCNSYDLIVDRIKMQKRYSHMDALLFKIYTQDRELETFDTDLEN